MRSARVLPGVYVRGHAREPGGVLALVLGRVLGLALGLVLGFVLGPAGAVRPAWAGEQGGAVRLLVKPSTVHPGDIARVSFEGEAAAARDPERAGVVGEIRVSGRSFPVIADAGRSLAFVGFDLDTKPGTQQVSFRVGSLQGRRDLVVTAKKFGSESLQVEPSYTDLDKPTLERVQREARRLRELWKVVTPAKLWREPFLKPTGGAFGSPFGLRRIFNGKPRSPHSGLDIKSPLGTPIRASNRGRVVEASELFFTGNTVVIDHGLGLYTLYAHMSRIDVETGDSVERGAVIGLVGATGRVTGPHLHWGAKLVGTRVDPVTLLSL